MHNTKLIKICFRLGSVIVALAITSLILVVTGAKPLAAFGSIVQGAAGSWSVAGDVLVAWVPLLLVTSGLLVTFTVGLWNIGIEGQIILGGIFTTWALRMLADSNLDPGLIICLAIVAGMMGGALWALLVGALKAYGGVNEIFGGLGLNFIATALNLWLIFGPWKRPGIASMSGTLPFDPRLWLPTTTPQSRFAPAALVLALVAISLIYLLIQRTHFGLRFKAVGSNVKAAYLLGFPTWKYMMAAFALCGMCAGLAGAVQVTGVYHRLIPSISSGYGYMGLMVSMLANYSALGAIPISFFFASLNVGSILLPITQKLDSSLAGIVQGSLVLFVILGQGLLAQFLKRRELAAKGVKGGH